MMKMRERGVEVLELHNLLAETLDIPEAKAWLLDRKIIANEVGLGLVAETRAFLESLDSPRPGPLHDRRACRPTTCPTTTAPATSPHPARHRGPRLPDAAAAQHALHPRHHVLAVRRGHLQPALLAGPAGRDPAVQGDLQLPPDVRRLDGVVGRPREGLGPGHVRGRRRDAGRQRRRARRHERAHLAPGDQPGRRRAVRPGRGRAGDRRRDAQAAGGDAPRHGLHLRRPRRRHGLPRHRRRHPAVLAAARRTRPPASRSPRRRARSSTWSPRRWASPSCA